jgi:hypothetical protein
LVVNSVFSYLKLGLGRVLLVELMLLLLLLEVHGHGIVVEMVHGHKLVRVKHVVVGGEHVGGKVRDLVLGATRKW